MNKYLINEAPLFVLPTLASKIGLNEAIIVQQLHFWLKRSNNEKAGHKWVYNTYDDWLEQFPFWSKITLRRAVNSLETQGIVISTLEFNRDINKTKWYRLDYDILSKVTGEQSHTEYLINEPPLVVLPTLAINYGLNEAMFLQQLHFNQGFSDREAEGFTWIAKPYSIWLNQFSFWSEFVLSKVIKNLTDKNLISNTDKYNRTKMQKTRWLRINYENIILNTKITTEQTNSNIEQSYHKNEQTNSNIEQSYHKNEQMNSNIEQSYHKNEQMNSNIEQSNHKNEQTNSNIEQSYHKNEQTNSNIEQSYHENEHIEPQKRADGTLILSSSYIGSDYKTDYKTDYDRSYSQENSKNIVLDKIEIEALTTKAVALFDEYCVNGRSVLKKSETLKSIITETISKYGETALEMIFEEVKRSDYLLGHTGTKPQLTWILKNAEAVLSGKYISKGDSKYESALKCNTANSICRPTTESKKQDEMCVHCPRWKERPEPAIPKTRTLAETAMDCYKATENSKHKEFQCPVLGKRELRHEYCAFCPRQEEYLRQEAELCFAKLNGVCSTILFKKEAQECCRFCPNDGNNPDKKKKKSPDNTVISSEIIEVDFRDNNDVWRAAHKWITENHNKISGFIFKYMHYLALEMDELMSEALIIAVETLAPLAAEQFEVSEKKFSSRFWNNLKYRFRQMQAVPSIGQITGTNERTACTMLDFTEIESYTNFNTSFSEFESDYEKRLQVILGILTIQEEEIIEHRKIYGSLTAKETAMAMGISYEKQRKLEASAYSKLDAFIKKYGITSKTAIERIKEYVEIEAKNLFPAEEISLFEIKGFLKTTLDIKKKAI